MLSNPLVYGGFRSGGRRVVPDVADAGLVSADKGHHRSAWIRKPAKNPDGNLWVVGMSDTPDLITSRLPNALESCALLRRLLLERPKDCQQGADASQAPTPFLLDGLEPCSELPRGVDPHRYSITSRFYNRKVIQVAKLRHPA